MRTLRKNEIDVKVKQVTEKGCVALLYKTARVDMDILDEEFTPMGWECEYREIKGNLYCGIGVKAEDGRTVWKWDCGIESREDEEGNQKKGEASDSFKRAGFKWGIGRELYTAPFIWIPEKKVTLKQGRNGKLTTYDKFEVEKITYDENRRISGLSIINQHRETVFTWSLRMDTERNPKEACTRCGAAIEEVPKKDGTMWTPNEIYAYSMRRFDTVLCPACMKEAMHG